MNDKLSQIIADLFSQPKPGEDWAARMQRFREEIKKIAERDETLYGKFLDILESVQVIIPDEKQRYHAAIQALAATLKQDKDSLLNAIGSQLAELVTIETGMAPVVPGHRKELTGWEARAKVLRNEINQLRDRIVQLEGEEQVIITYIAGRQQELDYVEKSMQQIFASLRAEIADVKNKIQEYSSQPVTVQPAAAAVPEPVAQSATPPVMQEVPEVTAQPAPKPVEQAAQAQASQPAEQPSGQPAGEAPEKEKPSDGKAIEFEEPPAPLDPKLQKRCPMCGGVMNYQAIDTVWMCYACAYEEEGKDGASAEADKPSNPAEEHEWRGERKAREYKPPHEDKSRKKSSRSRPEPGKKKECPVCRENMLWYPEDKAWRCNSCNYERSI